MQNLQDLVSQFCSTTVSHQTEESDMFEFSHYRDNSVSVQIGFKLHQQNPNLTPLYMQNKQNCSIRSRFIFSWWAVSQKSGFNWSSWQTAVANSQNITCLSVLQLILCHGVVWARRDFCGCSSPSPAMTAAAHSQADGGAPAEGQLKCFSRLIWCTTYLSKQDFACLCTALFHQITREKWV